MIYVALLRGINVGGNNKIVMSELREVIEALGFGDVSTHINTGNIIFSCNSLEQQVISQQIESAIETKFGFEINAIVRDYNNLKNIIEQIPESWQNDKQTKSDVMFLWPKSDNESVLSELIIKDFDNVIYQPGAILWNVTRDDQSRSGMKKLFGTRLYKQMTIRNVNTVRNIWEIMERIKNEIEKTWLNYSHMKLVPRYFPLRQLGKANLRSINADD